MTLGPNALPRSQRDMFKVYRCWAYDPEWAVVSAYLHLATRTNTFSSDSAPVDDAALGEGDKP